MISNARYPCSYIYNFSLLASSLISLATIIDIGSLTVKQNNIDDITLSHNVLLATSHQLI